MVQAVAHFTQTDAGMAGTTALGMLAAAAGGRVEVEVRPGWREPVNLFTATTAGPAERKSAVQAVMTRPLFDAEVHLAEAGQAVRREAETTQDVTSRAADQAKAKAGRADGAQREEMLAEAIAAMAQASGITVPAIPRIIADDVTPEAAASLLAEQGGRLAVISAEGGIFDILAGRYSHNLPTLDVFLKGHAGDPIRVDRRSRPPELVQRPALTLALMIQPAVLAAIARTDAFRGRGLLARFLYALPPSRVGRREADPAPVPPAVAQEYTDLIRGLAITLADWTDPAVLLLTPAAAELVIDIARRLEPRLGPAGDLAHIADWAGKLVGATVRIAGLIHLAEHPADGWRRPIERSSLERAADLGDYYLAHALAAFEAMRADPRVAAAQALLGVIRRLGREVVSKREIFTAASRPRFPKATDLDDPLQLLEEHGYLRRQPDPHRHGPGRPPSPTWAVHPSVLAETAETAQTPNLGAPSYA
jgi:hypothetical protein